MKVPGCLPSHWYCIRKAASVGGLRLQMWQMVANRLGGSLDEESLGMVTAARISGMRL